MTQNEKLSPTATRPVACVGSRSVLVGPRRLIQQLVTATSILGLVAGSASIVWAHATSTGESPESVVTNNAQVPDFSRLVERVKPAVVSVRAKVDASTDVTTARNGPPLLDPFSGDDPFKGTPFEHFFKEFRRSPSEDQFSGRSARPHEFAQVLGSGFFISPDGYVVTNNHVIDHAVKVELVTDAGKTYSGKVIGTDARTDLALLKVDGKSDFPYAKLALDMPKIGEWVLAVGNPFGLGGTVTAGIVSAEGRDIGSGPYDDFIQIDAPVNKGNSGGPTFNLRGEVIGVNTAIYSPSGGSVGIAFDIPATSINAVIPVLMKNGHVERAWLGVQIQPVTQEIAESLELKDAKGALISELQAGSPAERAGLKAGDVIATLNGNVVADAHDLARRIGNMTPNSNATLGVIRDGHELSVHLALGQLKDATVASTDEPDQGGGKLGVLGLSVAPAAGVEGAGNRGLAVTSVDPNGEASTQGVEEGDVILQVGGRDVATMDDLERALADFANAGKKSALVLIRHGGEQHYVTLPVAAA